jgi:hypothetical protein
VKTARYEPGVVERDLLEALGRVATGEERRAHPSEYLNAWYSPRALDELLAYRELIGDYPASADLMRVVLSRAARSARMAPHYDLEFPRAPMTEPYHCHKHARTCTPTSEALKFLRRYSLDTVRRVGEYATLRSDAESTVLHDDARTVEFGGRCFDGVITSPPYPGRIDYHEQHRYAFELLGLADRREVEIGAAARGRSRATVREYAADMTAVFARARAHTRPGGVFVIVIDDALGLYDQILADAGLDLVECHRRHVNRRTGRRAGEFYEQVMIATV